MNSHPPSLYSGFDLEFGDRVLFFLKAAIPALILLAFGVGSTSLLAAAACAAMGYEWFRLVTEGRKFDEPLVGIAISAAALPPFVTFAAGPAAGVVIALLAAGFLLFMGPKDQDDLHVAAPGLFLIGLAGVSFVWLRDDPQHGLALAAWVVLVVLATEVASGIGRHRSEKANEQFTTEKQLAFGLTSGVIAGTIVGAFYREGNLLWVIIASFLIAATVIAAGVATEYLKRRFEASPSGSLFMGRGAVIENLDGLVCASLFAGFLTLAGGALFSW